MSEELRPANEHPDFGKVCSHGQLKRKCYTCELEEEIERLHMEASKGHYTPTKEAELMFLRAQNHKMRKVLEEIEGLPILETEGEAQYLAAEFLKGERRD